jgi:hypothetical protein
MSISSKINEKLLSVLDAWEVDNIDTAYDEYKREEVNRLIAAMENEAKYLFENLTTDELYTILGEQDKNGVRYFDRFLLEENKKPNINNEDSLVEFFVDEFVENASF